MSQCDEFRQYAGEAMLNASQSKKATEIKALEELARVWVLAAFEIERVEARTRWPLPVNAAAQTARA